MRTYNKGFIFIDGELKTFNPLKWQMRFTPQEECMCTCEIGVGDNKEVRTIDISKYDIYDSENGFKSGCEATGIHRVFGELFRRVFDFYPIDNCDGTPRAFEFRDGEARCIEVDDIEFCLEITDRVDKLSSNRTSPLYESCEKVYLHNDYIVDGELRVSPKSKLALTDEQKKYLEMFKESLKKLKESNVRIVYELSNDWMYFVNRENVQSFEFYDPSSDFMDISDIVECVKGIGTPYMNFDNCESLYAKLK
jgi:hypothetical protein